MICQSARTSRCRPLEAQAAEFQHSQIQWEWNTCLKELSQTITETDFEKQMTWTLMARLYTSAAHIMHLDLGRVSALLF